MYKAYYNTKNYYPYVFIVVDDRQEISGLLLAVIQKEHSNLLGIFSAR